MLVFGGFQPTRAPNVSGLGGRGLPGADMTGGMPDMSQLLQNPAVSRMMQVLLSNPQYMQQIVSQNPQLLIRIDNTIMKNRNYQAQSSAVIKTACNLNSMHYQREVEYEKTIRLWEVLNTFIYTEPSEVEYNKAKRLLWELLNTFIYMEPRDPCNMLFLECLMWQ
ncbi:unnamed protein product [Lactuca saligna]|uniref:STI1 domain-containing protein n=1 Tax=Lactuca saligna TaxID=75948 RepID=A0AA35Z9R2_LACSI|nr:unnamed protein product [Lactuca saligna]